ncbi:pantoate--beta-alanine ligase [Coprobacter secundus]|jgi:pantoate--beta-alanine ligase|uniref:pantoate--beta-alanine ligase n=1 Tax=Coprobacter secundus TaxID=1501392 RepID=UPI000339E677|nr:pantoate--beta-alanine ligase [Coprobacter secundus]CCY38713.1 pantothenate synthetase [Tannerella sp. CAG:118]
MEIITKIADLQRKIVAVKANGGKVGLVPTMGALHNGHLQLVRRCVAENDCCVVSIFVNPTQFNDKNDLLHYPRTLEADCELLRSVGCTIAFVPSVEEMYPEEDTRVFELGPVAEVMEGKYRPGHFNGVAQIVSKLFYAVTPDRAYFGEKDFQQIAVIRSMVKLINSPVEIVDCPIVREEDGLALSSRNRRLTPEQRKNALNISATLFKSRTFAQNHTVAETLAFVVDTINAVDGLEVEYYEIVDGRTLLPVESWDQTDYVVGCVTVYCGEVRLIDNVIYHR